MPANWLRTKHSRKNDTEIYTGSRLGIVKDAESQLKKADIQSRAKEESLNAGVMTTKVGARDLPATQRPGQNQGTEC